MSISMNSASAPIFIQTLTAMKSWIDKAEAHATAKGFEADNYIGLRLTPDMFAFARQIQVTSDVAKRCIARLAEIDAPSWPDEEATMSELRERIQKTIDFIASVPEEKINGSEDREVQIPTGPGTFATATGQASLIGFALPNFFFHATMTYALLRDAGVELGKMDFLGAR
jgi:hypothetical protein